MRLVDRIRAADGRIVSVAASPVTTSARTVGRAPAGLSTYLQLMVATPRTGKHSDPLAEVTGELSA